MVPELRITAIGAENRGLRGFSGLRDYEPLSAEDINSFKLAAQISTLIRESVVAPSLNDSAPINMDSPQQD